jgi:hypothetical protein
VPIISCGTSVPITVFGYFQISVSVLWRISLWLFCYLHW